MKGKVAAVAALLALFLVQFPGTAGVRAAEGADAGPVRTVNDYDPALWELPSGVTAAPCESGGKVSGVAMSSADDFTVTTRGLDPMEIMIDFCVSAEGKDGEPSVVLSLKGETGEFAEIGVTCGEKNYSAELKTGSLSVKLSGVGYGAAAEGNRIQLRLAYDDLLNFETQVRSGNWNFVAGCDKASNGQRNVYTGTAAEKAAMGEIGQLLSEHMAEEVDLSLSLAGFASPRIFLTQLNESCYYDYDLFSAPFVESEDDIYYNRIAFRWTLPDTKEYPRSGFKVERLNGGRTEKVFVYDNAYASSLSENRLKQNTEYEYRVSAYEQVDTVLNAVACYKVAFKYEPISIHTLKGSFWYFVIALAVAVAVLAAVIVGYVFRFEIEKGAKKLLKKRDRDKTV